MGKILLSEKDIQKICEKLGKQLTEDLKDEERIPVFVGVLKGSVNFMMDLIKHVTIPIYTDYIQISSYRGVNSTGNVQLLKDISYDCEGRTVVIIEDIVDTGCSMAYLISHLETHKPKRVLVCALFNKEFERIKDVEVHYKGYELKDNAFLIGYGLDYYELERNVPCVYAVDEEDIQKLDDWISVHGM